MSIHLNPYLNFRGEAKEALEFYHSVFGGELILNRYDSIPGMMGEGDEGSKIMHGQLNTPDGLTIMAADLPESMADQPGVPNGGGSSCVWGEDTERITALWEASHRVLKFRCHLPRRPGAIPSATSVIVLVSPGCSAWTTARQASSLQSRRRATPRRCEW